MLDRKNDGEFIEYYSNGRIRSKANFRHGRKDGECFEYYPQGNILNKFNYKLGR